MNSEPNQLSEKLDILILASLDGVISDEQFAWLDKQIIENPEVAQYYVEFMSIYTGLRQPGDVSTSFSPPPKGTIPTSEELLLRAIEIDERIRAKVTAEKSQRKA